MYEFGISRNRMDKLSKALRACFSVIAHLLVFKERTLRNHEDPRPRQASSKVPKIPTDPISALFKASNVRIDDAARYSRAIALGIGRIIRKDHNRLSKAAKFRIESDVFG